MTVERKVLAVPCTPQEHRAIKVLAAQKGVTVFMLIRHALEMAYPQNFLPLEAQKDAR